MRKRSIRLTFTYKSAASVACAARGGRVNRDGNYLRQSHSTLLRPAGILNLDILLLMNLDPPGVDAGYVTRYGLLENSSRQRREKAFDVLTTAVGCGWGEAVAVIRTWVQTGRPELSQQSSVYEVPDLELAP